MKLYQIIQDNSTQKAWRWTVDRQQNPLHTRNFRDQVYVLACDPHITTCVLYFHYHELHNDHAYISRTQVKEYKDSFKDKDTFDENVWMHNLLTSATKNRATTLEDLISEVCIQVFLTAMRSAKWFDAESIPIKR